MALEMARLSIRATAYGNAQWAAGIYVEMHSLDSVVNQELAIKDQILWTADRARKRLSNDSYTAKMVDFIKGRYSEGVPWEQARDEIHVRYQVEQLDGYETTSRNLPRDGCFASGINFASNTLASSTVRATTNRR